MRQVVNPIVRAIRGSLVRDQGFDIASTNPSAYYDRTVLATLFQGSAGTPPVTAVGQPIGLGLDKSQGLVLGDTVIANGSFDADASWTKGAGWDISGGVASVDTVTQAYLTQTSAQSGKGRPAGWYEVELDLVSRTSGELRFSLASATYIIPGTVGHKKFLIYTTTTNFSVNVFTVGTTVASIDNISVKLLAGNHQLQAAAGKRPLTAGSPIYTDFDADDELITTFPASLGAGCTVCRSLPGTGASITTGVTLTATFTDNVDAHFLAIYTAAQWAALDAGQIANITKLLNQKAGL